MTAAPLVALLTDIGSALRQVLLPTTALSVARIFNGGHWKGSIGRLASLAV